MPEQHPPKWAEKFLLAFLKEELAEEVLGDLDEKFYSLLEKHSLAKARRNYWYQVFNYLRPFALKHFKSPTIPYPMLKHNFKISYRILQKNKIFSFINIGGLAIGMTVVLLIGMWITDEFSFNRNHENYDRLVQVFRKNTWEGEVYINSSVTSKLASYLRDNYPTLFEHVAMTQFRSYKQILTVDQETFDEMGYFFGPDAPEMLSLHMKAGNRDGLQHVQGMLISESLAQKLFPAKDPMGETIQLNSSTLMTVTGVFEDLPLNSTFGDASFLVSMELIYNQENPPIWDNYNSKVFAQLKPGIDPIIASSTIKTTLEDNIESGSNPVELFLHPMKDWHLNSEFENGVPVTSTKMRFIQLYGVIGLFVLLLACINFVNLNTARYQNRTKEIGVRKTLGSIRLQLINQFLMESLLYAFAAFLISILLVQFLLPGFNHISDKSMSFPWTNLRFWLSIIGFTIITAFLAGIYPAFFLSSFSPTKALKGNIKQGKFSIRSRQGLVVFQFTISIILIIGTIAVYQQIQYAKSRPVGYNQDHLITVKGFSEGYYQKYDLLREELKKTGVVEEMAESNYPLMNTLGNNNGFSLPGATERNNITFNTIRVTPEYGRATGWELIDGRDFSRDLGNESASIIVSESAVKELGIENPVGQQILSEDYNNNGHKEFTIVGVVRDMIKGSPFGKPLPLMVFPSLESKQFLFIRTNPDVSFADALPAIKNVFQKVIPDNPFNYEYVDKSYATKFQSEERIQNLATLFSMIAILISCLGLFGLSAFMVEQRTKEIGIRKILGASVMNLWNLLSKDYSLLILISCMIAIPLAYYFMHIWLQSYEYRTPIFWWIYGVGILSCFAITMLTVSYHTLRASIMNPVESLRSE